MVSVFCHTYCRVHRYTSPEVLLGEENYTTAMDIWSVGCVFVLLVSKEAKLSIYVNYAKEAKLSIYAPGTSFILPLIIHLEKRLAGLLFFWILIAIRLGRKLASYQGGPDLALELEESFWVRALGHCRWIRVRIAVAWREALTQ
ncbi:hypothetical protein PRUPE_2G159100 [Prunus persica]|uniref:Protein kinase domain-containing protein n=1 Tax=Prunus persica TaxID=3760 RepID=A0A251QGI0_PRUPE|nr:hypothetical protein PRUPE_2G159100 [Prunus persica]